MEIVPVSDHMSLISEMAALHQAEWAHFDPNLTVEARIAALVDVAGNEGVPSIFVAIENSEFCGSAALVEQDMDSHPELGPWLAAVFVKEKWRGRGIAKSLVQYCESEAKKSGIERLYLFTEFASELYVNLGWQMIERCIYKGVHVDVMCKEFAS